MTITKAELTEIIYQKLGHSKKVSQDLVDLIFEVMKEEFYKGEDIKISGFGKFYVRNKKARRGRNPQTGEEMEISERRVVTFRASRILKRRILGNPENILDDTSDEDDDDSDDSHGSSSQG